MRGHVRQAAAPGGGVLTPETDLPTTAGAVITYRGKIGFPWLGFLTGNGNWNVIRQDTWQAYKPREVEPAELVDEIGRDLTVIHPGLP
jgi:hypothetical protein